MNAETIQFLSRADAVMGRLIKAVGPCTLKPKTRRSPYETLVQSVVFQQLNGTAATTILNRVKNLFPHRSFPHPEDLVAAPDDKLRAAGLSRAKTLAVKDIATKALEGIVPASRAI